MCFRPADAIRTRSPRGSAAPSMRNVVVGVKGALEVEPALDFAVAEALRRRLPLWAVHAYSPPSFGEVPPALFPGHLRERRESATRLVTAALDRSLERVGGGRGLATKVVVMEGDAPSSLTSLAESAALLVIGARGGGVVSRTVHGSVAASCLHRCVAPVVVVPHDADLIADRWLRSRVVVGLDGSPASVAALEWAVAQAREWGSVLTPVVVSSLKDQPPAGFRQQVGPQARQDLTTQVWRQVFSAGGSDVEVHPSLLIGDPKQELWNAVAPADLLVLGSRGLGPVASFLVDAMTGPVALGSPCPVVAVQEGQARREIHQRRAQPQWHEWV